jgi:hypothetical protein
VASSRLRSVGSASPSAAPLSAQDELLRKLRTGEIDRDGFYNAVVEQGVAHLTKRMTPAQAEVLREQVREEVEHNPILAKMLEDALSDAS